MRLRSLSLLIPGVCMALLCVPAFAQQTGLSGVVTDIQGSVIQGAKVEATQTGGSSFLATTNAQGAYVLPSLVAAEYTITVSSKGFGTVQKKVLLLVGQLAQLDISLPVASASATDEILAGNKVPWSHALSLIGYADVYLIVLLAVSVVIFNYREI